MIRLPGYIRSRTITFDGTGTAYDYGPMTNRGFVSDQPTTLLTLCRPTGAGENNLGYLFAKLISSATTGIRLIVGHNSGAPNLSFGLSSSGTPSSPVRTSAANFVVYNQWNWLAATFTNASAAASTIELYAANALDAKIRKATSYATSTDGSGSITSNATDPLFIGNRQGRDRTFRGEIAYIARWNVALTEEELQRAQTDGPLSVRQGNLTWLWVAGNEIVANRAVSTTYSVAYGEAVPYTLRKARVIPIRGFTVASDMAGTSSMSFGDTGGNVLTGYNLQGSAALTFSSVPALNIKKPIAASTSFAFADNVAIEGKGRLWGGLSLLFSHNAPLDGFGALAGNAPVVFTSPGVALTGTGVGQMLASTSMLFGGTRTLQGFGPLSTAATVIRFASNATGSMSGNTQLAGTAAVGFSSNVRLSGVGVGVLAGTVNLAFSNQFITILCLWSGSTTFRFTPGPNTLSMSGALVGATQLFRFTTALTLMGLSGSALVGATTVRFASSTSLTGTNLRAASSAAFTTQATLTGIAPGTLAGATALTFTTPSKLQASAALVGNSPCSFTPSARMINLAPTNILGTATIAFTSSVAISGVGALAGLIIIRNVFSSRGGTLSLSWPIEGATSLAFSIDPPSLLARGALVGVSSPTFDSLADLRPHLQLFGTSPVAFSGIALPSGKGALAGVSSAVFSTTLLFEGAEGALQGEAAMVLSGAALFQGEGALAGIASFGFIASGTQFSSSAYAFGSSEMVWQGLATLAGKGELSGVSTVVFTAGTTADRELVLAGEASIAFGGQAEMGGYGALTGSGPLTWTLTGNVAGMYFGLLSGSPNILFTAFGDAQLTVTLRATLPLQFQLSFVPTIEAAITPLFDEIEAFITAGLPQEAFVFSSELNRFAVFDGSSKTFSVQLND